MTNFSPTRMWKLLRWQIPSPTTLLFITAGWTALFAVFQLTDVGFSNLTPESVAEGSRKAVETFWTLTPNMLCIITCTMFNRLSERQTACNYLMLPATMQEKFVVSLLLNTAMMWALMLVGAVVSQLLCAALYHSLIHTGFTTGLPLLADHLLLHNYYIDGRFDTLLLFDDLTPFLWFHSVCVLCATLSRRNAILWALALLLLLPPLLWLRSRYSTPLAGGLYDTWTLPLSVIFLILSATNYVAAYRLFPRRTITGHKFLSIR